MSSSRRAGAGAESILASLERDKAGVSGAHGTPPTQLAWLAGAAAVILLLIVILAWLAYSNATRVRVLPDAEARRAPPADLMLVRNDAPHAAALILDRQAMVMLAPASSTPPKVVPPPAAPTPKVVPKPRVAAIKVPARKIKAAAPAKREPEAVDTDVALLSAIIAHATRHAAESRAVDTGKNDEKSSNR